MVKGVIRAYLCGTLFLCGIYCFYFAESAQAASLVVGEYSAAASVSDNTEVEPCPTNACEVILTEHIQGGEREWKIVVNGKSLGHQVQQAQTTVHTITESFIVPAKGKYEFHDEYGSADELKEVHTELTTEGGGGGEGKEGPQGPPGEMLWRGVYSGATTYAKGDAVSEGGSSYISLKATNKGNTPSAEGEWWGLVAKEGSEGKEGKEGKAGAGGGGETKLTSFGPEAEVTLSELKESMELVGWCIVGTMLGLSMGFFLYRLLKPEGTVR